MKVYKLDGKVRCAICGEDAGLYIDPIDISVCRKCGVTLYRELGTHFVPRAVPNVILRGDKQNQPLSMPLYLIDEAKKEEGSAETCTPFKKAKSPKFSIRFKNKRCLGIGTRRKNENHTR